MSHLSIDIETFSSVDLKKAGLYKYVQSPDFQILLFAYSFNGYPVQIIDLAQGEPFPEYLSVSLCDPSTVKHAYNAAFEWYSLNKFFYSPLVQWRCTQMHGLYCGYTAGLAKTAEALGLPEDKRKMGIGKALIRTFCVPTKPTAKNGQRTRTLPYHEPEKWQLFKEYCKQDVASEMAVENRLSNFPVPDQEQALWVLDQQMNAYGVNVDLNLVDGALQCSAGVTGELMHEAIQISGLDNPKSVKQLSEWLEEETGEEITDLQKTTVKALIKSTDSDSARRMLEIRQELSKTSVKKYAAMNTAVCSDGRLRGILQFYGANRTGRWAGRLVQVHNLPKNHLETLNLARNLVIQKKADAIKVVYGNVPDILSQLIRTAFIPSPGNTFLVSDFSAIEARVIAWLAGEQWRLEVFRTHGKIYEASASAMFGVPLELIKKGNPEYDLRQKGKVAELALGYQGAAGALIAMGALNMGLTEEELPDIVKRWRSANKRIVDLWYRLENAALEVMLTGQPVGVKGLLLAREADYRNQQDFFTITLPSRRKLYYPKPYLHQNDFGKEALHYYGVDQKTSKWGPISTYGGKLVENCLAGDTEVLTSRGWVELENVLIDDLLWDGFDWVKHEGLINKGIQDTVSIDGVRVTPDHLILTERGWRSASSCEGYNRYETKLPDGYQLCRVRREEVSLAFPLRLWKRVLDACNGIFKRQDKVLRLPEKRGNWKRNQNAWDVKASCICCLAIDERALHPSYPSSVEELWRPWNKGLRKMAEQLRGFLGRHGANLQARPFNRSKRSRWRLLSGKLSLGIHERARQKQEEQSHCIHSMGESNTFGSCGEIRNRQNYFKLQDKSLLHAKSFVYSCGRSEQVYDLVNAGPLHRFTVKGENGPFIVHNCVQAIARDCLAESLVRLSNAGYATVMHIHDEVVLDTPAHQADLDRVCEIMGQPISWAPGLLLKAAGFKTSYYMKD